MATFWAFLLCCCLQAQAVVQGNNPPRLVNFDGFAQAPENAPRGTLIKTLTATDPDGPNEISFLVDRNSPETEKLVYLGPPTGTSNTGRSVEIFLKVDDLDRDYAAPERQLRFEVLDGLNSAVYASMTLFIQDVNDEAPQFRGTPYRTTVKEDTQVGTLVFNGTRTVDPDTGIGGAVTYSLELTDAAYRTTFRVTPYAGHIYLSETLDYEKQNFYQLRLTATDGYDLNSTTDVIVTVDDVQDTKPNFVNTPYRTTIQEDAAVGTSVISVCGLDGDRGNPNPIKYRFVNDTSHFNIHEDSGLITVASKLDSSVLREQGSVYDLTVQATEVDLYIPQRGETTATMLALITVEDVNDHTPRFNQSHYNGSVSENAQRGIPVKLDGLLQSIYVEDLDQNDNSIFEVSVMQNGQIYNVFNLRPNIVFSEGNLNMLVEDNSILDYEALMINQLNNVLTFTVRARETKTAERRSGEATFTVYVIDENDNFPQFTQSVYEVYINEHSPNGTVVTTITATDKDSGVYGEVSYTLQRGGDGKFRMLPNGTVIVEDGTNLDRERLDYYYLTVEARDGGGNRNLTQLIITLNDTNDHPPTFLRTQLTQFVEENKLFPPLILSASDADVGMNREVEYRLTLVPPSLQQNISLTTTPDGEASITISPNLDYEKLAPDQRPFIALEVTATDKGSPPLSSTATVIITVGDQNDNSPIFDHMSYRARIREDTRGKTVVVHVSATDDDGEAPNNEIQYSIETGGEYRFYMDPSSGQITVVDGVAFDRDTKDRYILKVLAQDKGSPQKTGTTSVTVTIIHVNTGATTVPLANSSAIPHRSDIQCGSVNISVDIPLSLLGDGYFTLQDPQCTLLSSNGRLTTQFGLTECGTTAHFTDDAIVYKNFINNHPDGMQSVEIACEYPRRKNLSMSYRPVQRHVRFYEKNFGTMDMTMRQFTSENFTKEIPPASYPVNVKVDEPVYIQVEVTSLNRSTLTVFPTSCIVTNSSSPHDSTTFRHLLRNGCKVDSSVVAIYPVNDGQLRFSFNAFTFTSNTSVVYIHCEILLCNARDLASECNNGCNDPSDTRARRSAATAARDGHFVSGGPFVLDNKSSTTDSSLVAVMVAVATISIVIAMVSVIVAVAFVRGKRAKNRNDEN